VLVLAAIRVAALPTSTLEEMRFDKSWAVLSEATELGRWLREEGARLSDELYEVIGRPEAAPVKPQLVALRRAIFNRRRLPSGDWSEPLRSAAPGDLAHRVRRWAERYRAREDLLARLPDLAREETGAMAARLWAALHAPAFRYGLVQGSPVLFEELSKWLNGPPDVIPARQTLLRLAKYLARVVAKTSPYSTFTISGLVPCREDVAEPLRPTGTFAWTSIAELNVWLTGRVATALVRHSDIAPRARLRENPSLVRDGQMLRFLGPGPSSPIVAMRSTPAVTECLRVVADQPGCTVDDVGRHLRGLDSSLREEEVRAFVARVVEAGGLHLLAPYSDQADDHLGELASWLNEAPPALSGMADAVLRLRDDLLAYPKLADPQDRLDRHRRIYQRLGDLVGAAESAAASATRGEASGDDPLPRKNLFHENAVFDHPVAECGTKPWSPVLDDLTRLRAALAAFDPCLPGRQALARVFTATYGVGSTSAWLDFYQVVSGLVASGASAEVGGIDGATFQALCAGPIASPPEVWRRLPFAAQQAQVIESAAMAIVASGIGADGVVRMTPEALAALTGDRLGGHALADPLTCYVQLLDAGVPPRVVVNAVTAGYGRGVSRIVRLLRQAGAGSQATGWSAVDRGPGGELVAESDGTFASNLNLRAPATEYELDYPYTTSGRPPRARIPLRDLDVTHDEQTGALHLLWRQRGSRLRPLHGGTMAEFWLPRPMRHLVEGFGPPPTLLHASMPLLRPPDQDPRAGGVWMLPRLEAGLVTLSRQCWAFAAREMPRRRKGETDTSFWLRLADWLAQEAIPQRFFLRVVGAQQPILRPDMKSRKPMYVDVEAWPLVALLERAIEDDGDLVVITEVLPDLGAAPRYGGAQHVTELVVELGAGGASDA
jgi:hypothetical protein